MTKREADLDQFQRGLLAAGRFLVPKLPSKTGTDLARLAAIGLKRSHSQLWDIVIANQKRVDPAASEAELENRVQQTFATQLANIRDLFRVSTEGTGWLNPQLALDPASEERLQELVSGSSAILFTAHFGWVDLAGQYLISRGVPLKAVTGPVGNQWLFDLVTSLRCQGTLETIEPGPVGLRQARQALIDGISVVVAADQAFGRANIVADFCGRPTPFPAGPLWLARETGKPLVGVFMVRSASGLTGTIHAPFTVARTDDRQSDMRNGVQKVAKILEAEISANPGQWITFQPLPGVPDQHVGDV